MADVPASAFFTSAFFTGDLLRWSSFFAGAFFVGARSWPPTFLAGAFFAGAFLAAVFLAAGCFAGASIRRRSGVAPSDAGDRPAAAPAAVGDLPGRPAHRLAGRSGALNREVGRDLPASGSTPW